MRVLGKRNKERLSPIIPALADTLKRYVTHRKTYPGTSAH